MVLVFMIGSDSNRLCVVSELMHSMPDDELFALKNVVCSSLLPDCSSQSWRINSQKPSNCLDIGSVMAFISRASSSNVAQLLDEFSISWSEILLGESANMLSVSVIRLDCHFLCLQFYSWFGKSQVNIWHLIVE